MTDREKILRRIKALLDKTVAAGCPVDEALAALSKAKQLIEEHGVTDAELASIGAAAYSQRTQSQSSSSPPTQPPPGSPPPHAHHGRVIIGAFVLFLLLGLLVAYSFNNSTTPARVATQTARLPAPAQTAQPKPDVPAPVVPDKAPTKETNGVSHPIVDKALAESVRAHVEGTLYHESVEYTVFKIWDTDAKLSPSQWRTPGGERDHRILAQAHVNGGMYLLLLVFDAYGSPIRGVICTFDRSGQSNECSDSDNKISHMEQVATDAIYNDKHPYADNGMPLASGPPAEPKKDTEPSGKFAAPDDEYVTDNDRCSVKGYNEVYVAGRLHCQRCPSEYEWDPQNQQCRLATSFRGESLPASDAVMTTAAIEQGLDGMLLKFSKPGGELEYLRFMADAYTDYVTYYGNVLPRMSVLEDKRKFMAHWPDRSYSIRPGTLKVTCPPSGNYCNATGIMNFTVISDSKRISGSAEFKYVIQLRKRAVGAFIASEDGKVLERQYEIVSADGNSCPEGYAAILHHKAGELYCRLRH